MSSNVFDSTVQLEERKENNEQLFIALIVMKLKQ